MAAKRKREDNSRIGSPYDLRKLLLSAIESKASVGAAILLIMEEYNFSPSALERILTEDKIDISFSNVQYKEIAPIFGLDPNRNMSDIATLNLCRSRVPTSLFRSIVQDIDVLLPQYGPLIEHETEGVTSRFLAPIFNRLIAQFGFAFRNKPEPIMDGRVTTKGKIEHYFNAFGSIAVLFIEVKLRTGTAREKMDAIAQMIAKCVG